MKDPAFLFYSSDFLTGTMTLTFEDKGKFIMLLAAMHQQGRMDEETIRLLVGSISDKLKAKFRIDEDGKWYNVRLEYEAAKRSKFAESRKKNGELGGRPPKKPTENLTNNPNETKEKPIGFSKPEPKNILPINENRNENTVEKGNIGTTEKIEPTDDLLIWMKENCKVNIPKVKVQLDEAEAVKLKSGFPIEAIRDVLQAMDNHKQLATKYSTVYGTALNWLKRRNGGEKKIYGPELKERQGSFVTQI